MKIYHNMINLVENSFYSKLFIKNSKKLKSLWLSGLDFPLSITLYELSYSTTLNLLNY